MSKIVKKPAADAPTAADAARAALQQQQQLALHMKLQERRAAAFDAEYQACVNAKPAPAFQVDPAHEARLNAIANDLLAFDCDWDDPSPTTAPPATTAAGAAASTGGSGISSVVNMAAAAAVATSASSAAVTPLRPDQTDLIRKTMAALTIKPPPWAVHVPDQAILDRVRGADVPPPSHLNAAPTPMRKKLHAAQPAAPLSAAEKAAAAAARSKALVTKKPPAPAVTIVYHPKPSASGAAATNASASAKSKSAAASAAGAGAGAVGDASAQPSPAELGYAAIGGADTAGRRLPTTAEILAADAARDAAQVSVLETTDLKMAGAAAAAAGAGAGKDAAVAAVSAPAALPPSGTDPDAMD